MNSSKVFREAFDLLKKAEGYIPKIGGDKQIMDRFFNSFLEKQKKIMEGYEGTDDKELAENLLYAVSRRVIKLCETEANNDGYNLKNR